MFPILLCLVVPCDLLPSDFSSEQFLLNLETHNPKYMDCKVIFWLTLIHAEAYLHAYCMALLLVKLSSQSRHLFLQHPFTDLKLLCLSCGNSQWPLLLNGETPQLYYLSFIRLQLWQLHKTEWIEKLSDWEEKIMMTKWHNSWNLKKISGRKYSETLL